MSHFSIRIFIATNFVFLCMEKDKQETPRRTGRPKNLIGTGKTKIVALRVTEAELIYLKDRAASFSNSKYNVALYVHCMLFDNCFQQLSGEQLISTIKSIVDAMEANNTNLTLCAKQIEEGVKNQILPPSCLVEIKEYLTKHSNLTRKLQTSLSKALRAATSKPTGK